MGFNITELSFLGYSEGENFSAGPWGRYFSVFPLALQPLHFVPELFLEVKAFFFFTLLLAPIFLPAKVAF